MRGFQEIGFRVGLRDQHVLVGVWISLILVLTGTCLAQTVESTVEPIDDDEEYACITWDDGETSLGMWDEDEEDYLEVSFSRELRAIKRTVQSLKKKLTRAKRRRNQSLIESLQAQIAYWNDLISNIQACRLGAFEGTIEEPTTVEPITVPTPPVPGAPGNACTLIGAPSSQISAQIINGQVCGTAESAVVYLAIVSRSGEAGSCTGTVVTQNAIITAAHCLEGSVDYVDVSVGSRTVRASAFHSHPSWSASQPALENHDVAVVLLSQPLNAPVFPILSGNDAPVTAGEQVLIAGYGLTQNLKQEGLRSGFMTVSAVTELLIEARYDGTTGSNSCNGDSGGPLFVKRGEQWYLAGDTSNGDAAKCGVTEGSDISRWANLNAPSNRAFILQHVGL